MNIPTASLEMPRHPSCGIKKVLQKLHLSSVLMMSQGKNVKVYLLYIYIVSSICVYAGGHSLRFNSSSSSLIPHCLRHQEEGHAQQLALEEAEVQLLGKGFTKYVDFQTSFSVKGQLHVRQKRALSVRCVNRIFWNG
jgi:hypothetical protein